MVRRPSRGMCPSRRIGPGPGWGRTGDKRRCLEAWRDMPVQGTMGHGQLPGLPGPGHHHHRRPASVDGPAGRTDQPRDPGHRPREGVGSRGLRRQVRMMNGGCQGPGGEGTGRSPDVTQLPGCPIAHRGVVQLAPSRWVCRRCRAALHTGAGRRDSGNRLTPTPRQPSNGAVRGSQDEQSNPKG